MTIYDIAKVAGVSASSVSRVVNNKPGVSAEMREKILILLDKYHYVPNATARGLVTNSSKLVGILVADIRSQHHIEGTYHITNELTKRGYCCLIFNTGSRDEDYETAIRTLEQRKVEAVVLMGSIFQNEITYDMISRYLPEVPVFMLNGYLDLPNVYGVLSDECSGVEDCVKLLSKKNKQNIAFFVDKPTPSSKLKTEGFVKAMAHLGRGEDELWIYKGVDGSVDGGYLAAQRLLAEHPEVDGLICSLDIIACGALRALANNGRRVPQDVAVVGIDNSVYAEISTPRLTSLDNMIFDSGVTIAHKLIDLLDGHPANRKTLLITSIVERETT